MNPHFRDAAQVADALIRAMRSQRRAADVLRCYQVVGDDTGAGFARAVLDERAQMVAALKDAWLNESRDAYESWRRDRE